MQMPRTKETASFVAVEGAEHVGGVGGGAGGEEGPLHAWTHVTALEMVTFQPGKRDRSATRQ